jgi:protein-tyrosine phosphatase
VIDLHNHILPALDDGAADIAESMEIARQFVAEGVSAIAATPHLNPTAQMPVDRRMVEQRLALVCGALDREGIPLEVVRGNEVYLVPEVMPLLKRGRVCSLGESSAILVELPFEVRPLYLDDLVFQIQLAGHNLILAHPERYRFVQRDPLSLRPLVDRDVALQVTAPALLGEYGGTARQTAETLLQEGLVALGASDRHHPGPERSLKLMYDRIATLTDEGLADLILRENPRRVLAGEAVLLPGRTWTPPRKRGIFDRFRSRSL